MVIINARLIMHVTKGPDLSALPLHFPSRFESWALRILILDGIMLEMHAYTPIKTKDVDEVGILDCRVLVSVSYTKCNVLANRMWKRMCIMLHPSHRSPMRSY